VVIDSPDHHRDLDELPLEQVRSVVDMYLRRLAALSSDPRFCYVQLFKNHGREAGASLSHPHTQIIATPVLPPEAEARLTAARDFHSAHGQCLVCELARRELEAGKRVVMNGEHFLLLSPYDARGPFELLILPREHEPHFTRLSQPAAFAHALKEALSRLRALLGDVPYNFVLHTAPQGPDWPGVEAWYHWHLEIIPRLTKLAGFEWGTGMFINPMPPELAAEYLREAKSGG
jgi:UDPglucose--hexose-1-phosphate uridylyltransferase